MICSRRLGVYVVLTAVFILISCTSKAVKRRDAVESALDKGDYIAVINSIKATPKSYGETNMFLYNMDIGVLYHYIEHYDSSTVYLQRAINIYDELFTRSVTNEAAALLTNDNVRPYRARPYELIIAHQFAALNFMATGKLEEALVETRKAQILFNEWERIGAADGKYHTDGMFHLLSSLAFEAADEQDNSLISLFKSVHAYQLGPVRLPSELEMFAYERFREGDRDGDIERLRISGGDNPNGWSARHGESEIVILGYVGKGPNMRERNWSGTYVRGGYISITAPDQTRDGQPVTFRMLAPPLPNQHNRDDIGTTFHIKLSVPELQTFNSRTSYFTARLDGAAPEFTSVKVNDIELQARKALDDAWSGIIGRMAVRVVLRMVSTEAAKSRITTHSAPANFLINRSMDLATDQLEKADIRMCFMLPQQIHVIRFPVEPGVHAVTLNIHDARGNVIEKRQFVDVEVKRGEKRILFHNSLM